MGGGSDSHRSSSEDEDGGDPQYNVDPGVEQKSTLTKKSRGRIGGGGGGGGGSGRGRPAKSRVRVSDDQAPGAGGKARRRRRPGRKRSRKRVSDDEEEEEVMPQRKRRGLAEENFVKKGISESESESESEEEDEASAKKQQEMPWDVITKREVDEEAGEIVAEKVAVEKFDEKERTTGKKKRRVEVENTEIAEKSDELLAMKRKSGGEVERLKDVVVDRELDDEAEKNKEEVVADKRAERFHEKEKTDRKKKPQVKVEKAEKVVKLGDENFMKEETADKSDKEDELITKKKKKKRRGEVERLENVTRKREADEEAEELVAEKERTAGKKKGLVEVEKMGMDSRKRSTDDEDEGVLEDKNLAGALKNVGDSKSSRRPNQKKSEEGEVRLRPQRGQRGKEQQLDKEIRKRKRRARNVMADEALEETEQDVDMEVTELYC